MKRHQSQFRRRWSSLFRDKLGGPTCHHVVFENMGPWAAWLQCGQILKIGRKSNPSCENFHILWTQITTFPWSFHRFQTTHICHFCHFWLVVQMKKILCVSLYKMVYPIFCFRIFTRFWNKICNQDLYNKFIYKISSSRINMIFSLMATHHLNWLRNRWMTHNSSNYLCQHISPFMTMMESCVLMNMHMYLHASFKPSEIHDFMIQHLWLIASFWRLLQTVRSFKPSEIHDFMIHHLRLIASFWR